MKRLPFIKSNDLQKIKANLGAYVNNFKEDSSSWLKDELGPNVFAESKLDMLKFT